MVLFFIIRMVFSIEICENFKIKNTFSDNIFFVIHSFLFYFDEPILFYQKLGFLYTIHQKVKNNILIDYFYMTT